MYSKIGHIISHDIPTWWSIYDRFGSSPTSYKYPYDWSCFSHTYHPPPAGIGSKVLDLNPWTPNVILNETSFWAHIMFALQPALHTCCCSARQPYKLHRSAYGTYHCGSVRKWSKMPHFAWKTCYGYHKDLWNLESLINEEFFYQRRRLRPTNTAKIEWEFKFFKNSDNPTSHSRGRHDANITIWQNENLLQSAGKLMINVLANTTVLMKQTKRGLLTLPLRSRMHQWEYNKSMRNVMASIPASGDVWQSCHVLPFSTFQKTMFTKDSTI